MDTSANVSGPGCGPQHFDLAWGAYRGLGGGYGGDAINVSWEIQKCTAGNCKCKGNPGTWNYPGGFTDCVV